MADHPKIQSATLRATTWAHVRGLAPLAAAGQAYADAHGLGFVAETHSARTFGEGPLDELARDYDVIVFDHPLTGEAAERGWFLPLDEHLSAETLADREQHSVGGSYRSYVYGGRVWGLPLDAACIVCAVREDLVGSVPASWDDVMTLARAGQVAQPFSRMSATALFFTLCGGLPHIATRGGEALERLRELYEATDGERRLEQGAIQVLGEMAAADRIAFVPACYGYSTYSRPGFARRRVDFHPTPLSQRAVLGGAGIAVSALTKQREHALRFVAWITGAECQTHVYAVCGGQPAHAQAWNADLPNQLTRDFYRRTRPAMESGRERPNTPAFHHFQGQAATLLRAWLTGTASPRHTLDSILTLLPP